MNSPNLSDSLRQTLEDYRLTRSERQALKSLINDSASNENELAMLRREAFEIARQEMESSKAREVLGWLEEVTKLLLKPLPAEATRSHAVFSTQEDCAQYLRGLISTCRKSIDVCVFTITDDRITSSLLDAYHRKVKIRIVSDDEKASDPGSDIYRLKNSGIDVRTDRDENHMHHKFALFDGERLLNGSYNWTRSAATRNEENFVVTDDRQLVREFSSHFERLWHLFG